MAAQSIRATRAAAGSAARLPGAAIDAITDPTRALSWPWGRITLKTLAVVLFLFSARFPQVEWAERRGGHQLATPTPRP